MTVNIDDESEADDGAVFHFWQYLEARRRRHLPDFDLEDVAQLHDAVRRFEDEEPHP